MTDGASTALAELLLPGPEEESSSTEHIQRSFVVIPRPSVALGTQLTWDTSAFMAAAVLLGAGLVPMSIRLGNPVFSATANEPDELSSNPFSEAGASTEIPADDASVAVERELSRLFAIAMSEEPEDNVESALTKGVASLVKRNVVPTLAALKRFVLATDANVELTAEAVRSLGTIDDEGSRNARRELLQSLLEVPSTRIRYAAASALAAMDEPGALTALRQAAHREGNRRLADYLRLVVEQLELTRSCLGS